MNQIQTIYEENNFPALERLYKLVKKANPDVKRKEIKEFLNNLENVQITKEQKNKKATGHIVASSFNEVWQIDIFDLSKYSGSNNGYKYIFAIVDVFSRQALCIAMKNKNNTSCVMALEFAIKDRGKPRVLTSDNDSSFLSSDFTNLLDKLGIVLDVNVLGDHNALGIIDNFAKRIKMIFTAIFLTK